MRNNGNLTVNVGGMFSGKTSELLRQGKRHILAKDVVIYVKPSIDSRFSEDEIVAHTGDCTKAIVVDIDKTIIVDEVLSSDVVLIDEVQFFNEQIIEDIVELVGMGKKVYCSGLDLTFNMQPFNITGKLMCLADTINKYKAVCGVCGNDAYVSAKKDGGNSNTIDVGASDKYIPLCKHCYAVKGAL